MDGNLLVKKDKEFSFILGIKEAIPCFTTPDFDALIQIPLAAAKDTPTTTNLLSVCQFRKLIT